MIMQGNAQEQLVNVLLVEDNEFDIELTKCVMEEDHIEFNLYIADNGQDAIDFLTSEANPRIDLILLDINMPYMDGFGFLENRNLTGKPVCPVVMCSTSTFKDDIEKCYALGANDYIEKPPTLDKIKLFVEKIPSLKLLKNSNGYRLIQAV